MLNARQLLAFYWAAKLGSFTAAAARLNTTQSAISMRVRELENALEVTLFDRGRRSAVMTAKGQALLGYAEQMLRLSFEAVECVSEGRDAPETLRLGVAEVVSITWLPKLVHAIHASHPHIRLELDEALTQNLLDHLHRGALDLVLAPGRPTGPGLDAVPLGSVEFAWMASPSLGLPGRRLGPRDLQEWPVIALAEESHHHAAIEHWFSSQGAKCRRIDTCKSTSVAASLAAAGLGVTFLPVRCYRRQIQEGKLLIVKTTPTMAPVEFTAVSSKDNVDPFVRRIANLANTISDFEKAGSGGKRRRRLAAQASHRDDR